MALFPEDRPPIAWTLWERVRAFGSASVCLALFMVGVDLLIADIPGERAFSPYTPGGAIALWPWVRTVAVTVPAAGIIAAVLIPLFKHRHGGIAVGGLIGLVLLAGSTIINGAGDWDFRSLEAWQRLVAAGGFVGLLALGGSALSDSVLGRDDAATQSGPPVT